MSSLRIRTRLGLGALLGVALSACTLSGGIDLPSRDDGGDGAGGPGLNAGGDADAEGAAGAGGAGGEAGGPSVDAGGTGGEDER